jgi:autotransporter-associated beta strand protein
LKRGGCVAAFEQLEPRILRSVLYWDPDGDAGNNNMNTGAGLGGTGTWDTCSARWYDPQAQDHVQWSCGDEARFWGDSAGTVTLGEDIFVSGILFRTSGYTLEGYSLVPYDGGSNCLSVSSETGISATISSAIDGTCASSVEADGNLTLNGRITGCTSFCGGGGLVTLGCELNDYTGGTHVSNGTLQVTTETLPDGGGGLASTSEGDLLLDLTSDSTDLANLLNARDSGGSTEVTSTGSDDGTTAVGTNATGEETGSTFGVDLVVDKAALATIFGGSTAEEGDLRLVLRESEDLGLEGLITAGAIAGVEGSQGDSAGGSQTNSGSPPPSGGRDCPLRV